MKIISSWYDIRVSLPITFFGVKPDESPIVRFFEGISYPAWIADRNVGGKIQNNKDARVT